MSRRKAPLAGELSSARVALTPAERKAVAAMAKRSGVSVQEWIRLSVLGALRIDEAHWREMDDREAIAKGIDRHQFGVLSVQLRGLGPGAIDQLVQTLVLERQKGREEGSASALRLAAVRLTRRDRGEP